MNQEPAIKGIALIGIKKFILQEHGEKNLEHFMERFTKEELLIIGKALSPVTRVPASLYRKIYSVVKELFGQGRGEYFSEIHEYVQLLAL